LMNLACERVSEGASITEVRSPVLKMIVSIEFLGMQRLITKTDVIDMPIKDKTTVNDALEYIRHQYPALHLDKGMMLVTVNQKVESLDRILMANDTVSFLPFISGG